MVGARALWVDIDVGPGKPYATREEALQALAAAMQTLGGGTWRSVGPDEVFPPDRQFRMNVATGQSEVFVPAAAFPSPTMIIASGSGLHVLLDHGRADPQGPLGSAGARPGDGVGVGRAASSTGVHDR